MSILLLIVIIIFLLLSAWLILLYLRVVPVRQALVICSSITGNVRRVIIGPRIALVWPVEKILPLDLMMQRAQLNLNDLITADLAIVASLDIFYAFDPTLLQTADLDRILPILINVERIVQSWADYILRSLAAGHTATELIRSNHRARLERLLRSTLQDRLQPFGVRIYTIRLLCQPAPMMLDAQLAAARKLITAEAHAQELAMLTTALGSGYNLNQILPLKMLQQVERSGTMTALNLSLPAGEKVNGHHSPPLQWFLASR